MNYVREVTCLLQSRRSDLKILSPLDYLMVAEWEKQEIPLVLVIAAINEICDQIKDDDTRIRSVSYFQETINRNYDDWLQGKSERD